MRLQFISLVIMPGGVHSGYLRKYQDWKLCVKSLKNFIRYKVKIMLATFVEGDLKAPFSIATTPRCRRECYSIPWIAPPYPWSSPYSAECLARWHQVPFFESLVWLDLGLNPSHLDHWLTLYSLGQWPVYSSLKKDIVWRI